MQKIHTKLKNVRVANNNFKQVNPKNADNQILQLVPNTLSVSSGLMAMRYIFGDNKDKVIKAIYEKKS